jgi:hypothetical protein
MAQKNAMLFARLVPSLSAAFVLFNIKLLWDAKCVDLTVCAETEQQDVSRSESVTAGGLLDRTVHTCKCSSFLQSLMLWYMQDVAVRTFL